MSNFTSLIDNIVITIGNRLNSVNFLYLILNMLWKLAGIEMCQNLLGYARGSEEVGKRVWMSAKPSELSREARRRMSRVETYFSFTKVYGKINYLCFHK